MAEDPALQRPLTPGSNVTAAEVVHVIRHESAVHLTDIVLRRTAVGAGGHPGADLLAAAGAVAARELGWDQARLLQEIAAVEVTYRVP